MSNINRIIGDLPENLTEVHITYYDGATINNFNFESGNPPDVVSNRENNLPTSIPFSTDAPNNSNNFNPSNFNDMDDIINFADALSNSINIELINNPKVSISQLIENTKIISYKCIEDGDEKCHICNEPYSEDDICRQNNVCNHYFHQTCIDNWYSNNNKCPICQRTFN